MTEDDRDHKPDALPAPPPLREPRRGDPSTRSTPPVTSPLHSPERTSGEDDWLLVGQVVGVFGVRGELKVRPETDFPGRFAQTPTLYLGADHLPLAVTGARIVREQVLLRLAGVDDATAAEKLRGIRLYVPLSQAMTLPPDQYYLHDIIGARAERPDGTLLGTITDVYTGAAQDTLVVREAGGGREVLVPSVKEMIKRIDPAARVVVIAPIPGLFDQRFEVAEPTTDADSDADTDTDTQDTE